MGSQSFSSFGGSRAPKNYSRTGYCPLGATKHPKYSYGDNNADNRGDPDIVADRYDRHGWGDTTLLKEEGYQGVQHPHGCPIHSTKGKARPPSPHLDDRKNLFSVLQGTEAGHPDQWLGHPQIDPTKGKRSVRPPSDPKGRRDLFDVLHARNPGAMEDDSWLGHNLIDPAKGKGKAPGPEQTRGRPDLFEIFQQRVMTDPERLEYLKRGKDPLGDAWCGNGLIDPALGKRPLALAAADKEAMLGATYKYATPPDHDDFGKMGKKPLTAPAAIVHQVLQGTATGDDWGKMGRRPLPEPRRNSFDGRRDMYSLMTFKPVDKMESAKLNTAFDDRGPHSKKLFTHAPGNAHPNTGPDLLVWKPSEKVGNHVPYGGLMQEQYNIHKSTQPHRNTLKPVHKSMYATQ